MPDNYTLLTSESVSIGHPDKIADQISDAILDACLEQDPRAKVACETLVAGGLVVLAGEITTSANVDYQQVVRDTIREIGYDDPSAGFDYRSCGIISCLNKQSEDIAAGVLEGKGLHEQQGAGDQGMMFGYACTETKELMPLPIILSHKLILALVAARREGKISYLRPDAKAQVTMQYDEDGQPQRIHTVVLSSQHEDGIVHETVVKDLKELAREILPKNLLDEDTIFFINPTGRFVIGGPVGDTGLTGRKIMVDTYGGIGRHGGGAFSGKDPSKVDRSAAYAARYLAKNVIAAGLAEKCEVQLAYAIGVAKPVSIKVDTFGTNKIPERKIIEIVSNAFDLSPRGIIQKLALERPIYKKTSFGGHFGRSEKEFSWEQTDLVEKFRSEAGAELVLEKKISERPSLKAESIRSEQLT